MEISSIFDDLNKISKKEFIRKIDLMKILKKFSSIISVQDLMIATAILREDGKYVQASYREKYLEVYVKYFIIRVKDIKNKQNIGTETINKEHFVNSIDILKKQFEKERKYTIEQNKFPLIYILISLYATFILDEPIHPIGTPFPGSLKVKKKNGVIYCPVKDKQSENENAVCKLCIAKQDPDI